MTTLARYDAACAALAAAVKADEVMAVRLEARAIEAVAKVAKNLDLEIQAHQLRTRAEVRLGEMMLEAEEKGYLARRGGQPKARDEGSDSEPSIRAKLREIGVDKKLSARAKRLGGIGQQAVEVMLTRMRAESIKRGRIASDIIANELAGRSAESRRALARELSEASKPLSPSGQKVPVLYADPAWQRKAGIGNRAYENHYGTMAWEDILAMPVAKRLLPDAWGFIWIPRAHLLALVETEVDTPLGRCRMKIPLAWAIQIKWGFDSYSTCAVWTKTDEECPDDHGTGLIFWDQDELLLVFKRGNGLPKPDSAKKFGSNYRARAGRHSEKPAFYRDMINAMTGGLPVLELFAREDDEHVLPANFITWGNQSRNTANAVSCETSADSNLPPHDPETGEVIDDNDGVRNAPEGGISVLPGEGDDLDVNTFGGGFLRRQA
jgi:N6-adenosine-specific RNA methylase IME4